MVLGYSSVLSIMFSLLNCGPAVNMFSDEILSDASAKPNEMEYCGARVRQIAWKNVPMGFSHGGKRVFFMAQE